VDGLLIVNKPAGITSHDVVARVRRILDERSVGHLGTLDPSATGVLPLVMGRFTRLAAYYNDADKRYEGTIRFGRATDSYDAEGDPVGEPQAVSFSLEQLQNAAGKFVGIIQQVPPPFSAKKIAGVPAYKMARKKQTVELEPRQVEIKEFEILDFDGECARFNAWVGSGTYIRSLAHDLGKLLGSGAHLTSLTRTAVREFALQDAHTLEELTQSASFVHPRLVLPELPAVTAPPEALARIRHGNSANLPAFGREPLVRVFADQWKLAAIARRIAGTLFQPKLVLI
jgi:tRNA pseudouridine55 synthase